MNKSLILGAALFAGASILGTTAVVAQDTWIRKGEQEIVVAVVDGKLMCTRNSDGFELCHGMEQQADGSWTGDGMKHPDMPKFMTFNGTVTMTSAQLKIKGCAMGQSLCDAEIWEKK